MPRVQSSPMLRSMGHRSTDTFPCCGPCLYLPATSSRSFCHWASVLFQTAAFYILLLHNLSLRPRIRGCQTDKQVSRLGCQTYSWSESAQEPGSAVRT